MSFVDQSKVANQWTGLFIVSTEKQFVECLPDLVVLCCVEVYIEQQLAPIQE